MKKLLYTFLAVSIIFSACDKDKDDDSDVTGCMDDCAVNYLETATIDDGLCIYDFSGTYVVNTYEINGVSAFSSDIGYPYLLESVVIFASDGTYETIDYLSDGTIDGDIGEYVNTLTTVGLYSDDPLEDDQFWNIVNINCLEFDGTSTDANGNSYYIELDFVSTWTPPTDDIVGCMDDCAVNYDPLANINGDCLYSFSGVYVVNTYEINDESIFSNPNFGVPTIEEMVVKFFENGTYEVLELYSDGTIDGDSGTYENTLTTVGLYSDDPLEDDQFWNIVNINCLEFDGESIDDNGNVFYIELDWLEEN